MKIVFIDTETTGTRPVEKYAVIQIAGIVCSFEPGLPELESFDFTCAPHAGDVATREALEVNKRAVEEIRGFEDPISVHSKLTAILGRHCEKFNKTDKLMFAAYNASFDADHLRAWFDKCGDKYFGSYFWTPAIDVMSLAAQRLIRVRSSMPNFKLGTVAGMFGVTIENAHNALDDVRATKTLYEICTMREAA